MATEVITIKLNVGNTNIATDTIRYNIEIIVDLSSIWSYITRDSKVNRLYVETTLRIPTIQNGVATEVDISIIDYFNIIDVADRKITQYGYFEGIYDDTREAVSGSNVWCYSMKTYA